MRIESTALLSFGDSGDRALQLCEEGGRVWIEIGGPRQHLSFARPDRGEESLPLAALERLELCAISDGRRELSLRLEVTPHVGSSWSARFRVRDLDRREEAMDLAFRIAHATAPLSIGGAFRSTARPALRWYAVRLSDPATLSLLLLRAEQPGARPVPELEGPPGYERDLPTARFVPPAYQIARFSPGALLSRDEIVEWSPGARVMIERSEEVKVQQELRWQMPQLWALGLGLGLLWLTVASLVMGWLPVFLFAAGIDALFVFALIERDGAMTEYKLRRLGPGRKLLRQVLFRWATRHVHVTDEHGHRAIPFQRLRGLTLRGHRTRLARGGEGFWCELSASLQAGELWLVRTEVIPWDSYRPYEMLCPMAAELARALSIPWEWKGPAS